MTSGDALHLIVDLAVETVAGVTGASMSVVLSEDGHLETANASSDVFCSLDECQYEAEDGPCVGAIRSGAEQTVAVGQGKYSQFEEAAAQAGMAYVWSLPLAAEGERFGALNLYSSQVDHRPDSNSEPARALARLAAKVLADAGALDKAHAFNARLPAALASRALVGQAQGIVMARERIAADRAFDILRRASQRTNRKVGDLAAELVASTTTRPNPDPDDHGDR